MEYFNDKEIYRNFYLDIYLKKTPDLQDLVKLYIQEDIKGNEEGRREILGAMGVQFFMVYKDPTTNKVETNIQNYIAFTNQEKHTIFTYNGFNFDDIIGTFVHKNAMDYMLRGNLDAFLKETKIISDSLINLDNYRWTIINQYKLHKQPFDGRDVMRVLYLDKQKVSLKYIGVVLKHYRLQELPISPHNLITPDQVSKVIKYCINDILILIALYYNQIDEFELRDFLSMESMYDFRNMSRSSIGKKLSEFEYIKHTNVDPKEYNLIKTFRDKVTLKDIINPNISFVTPQLQDFFRDIQNTVVKVKPNKHTGLMTEIEFEKELVFNGVGYSFKLGGLHSHDIPNIEEVNTDYFLEDRDVDSYYPNEMINDNAFPEHLDLETCKTIMNNTIKSRIHYKNEAKKEKDRKIKKRYKLISEGKKIVINRTYGAEGDPNDPYYDIKAMLTVTVNGQLKLLKLIEMLYLAGFTNYSANTDGIVTKVPYGREEEFDKICKEWEQLFEFKLSSTVYERYICRDVNNYIAIKKGFRDLTAEQKVHPDYLEDYVKAKGYFVDDIVFDKGYAFPIIKKAIRHYFLYDIPIRDTICGEGKAIYKSDIHDYLMCQKVNHSFDVMSIEVINGDIEIVDQQNINRYYISKYGGTIIKRPKETKYNSKGKKIGDKAIIKTFAVKIVNDIFDPNKDLYDINYNFYIGKAESIILTLLNSKLKLF